MLRLISKLALAHLFHASAQKNIGLMVKLCFITLTISAFALTLVVGIMNGFQKKTAEKLQGIHADMIIRSAEGGEIAYQKLIDTLLQEFPQLIVAASPQAFAQLLLQTQKNNLSPLSICIGIIPEQEEKVTTLAGFLKEPHLLKKLSGATIVMGSTAAENLNLRPQERLNLLYIPEEPSKRKITLQEAEASLLTTFKTGIEEFDTALVFCHLDFFKKLFPHQGVTQISLKCTPGSDIEKGKKMLQQRFSALQVFTWKDLYPALVAALALEKYAAFLVLALCALIAAINCLALIFMYITQKKREIALLKTMGMSDSSLTLLFVLIGFFITLCATLCGIIAAVGVGWLIERYPVITLPDAYYVEHIPVCIDAPLMCVVLITMLLLGIVASYIPARRIHLFSVPHILKYGAE